MKFFLTPLDYVVLVGNLVDCEEADYGAERTKEELLAFLNSTRWKPLKQELLEEALYCCNMNHEKGKFYHPMKHSFKDFVEKVVPSPSEFDFFWNLIKEKKHGKKTKDPVFGLGDNPQSSGNNPDQASPDND